MKKTSAQNTRIGDEKDGAAALVAAALIWGCFPLYWSLLHFTDALDILSNRIIWSFAIGIIVLKVMDGRFLPQGVAGKQIFLLLVAATLLSFNWGISIYAVQINRVVEGGIGMYFAPIFQLILGRIIFDEMFNRTKWIVISISIISAMLLVYELGETPFIALGMGLSFAGYASVKKIVEVPSRESFVFESSLMLVPAFAYIALNGSRVIDGNLQNISEITLLIGAGLIAAPPLILYGFGAQRTTLSTSSMILNVIPIVNIVIGVAILNETFSTLRGISTILISFAVFYYTFQKGK